MMKYSTRFPDGRTLEYIPAAGGKDAEFRIDGETVTEAEAAKAWDAQDADWQRGRTLQQTLAFWQGR